MPCWEEIEEEEFRIWGGRRARGPWIPRNNFFSRKIYDSFVPRFDDERFYPRVPESRRIGYGEEYDTAACHYGSWSAQPPWYGYIKISDKRKAADRRNPGCGELGLPHRIEDLIDLLKRRYGEPKMEVVWKDDKFEDLTTKFNIKYIAENAKKIRIKDKPKPSNVTVEVKVAQPSG